MNSVVTLHASSLGELFDCPARWEAKHILGKRTPSTGRAQLGRAVHASTAIFDRSTIEHTGLTIDETAAAAVDVIRHPDEEVQWEEDSPDEAEKIALALHSKYCHVIAPQQDYEAVEIECERLEISDLGIALQGTTDRVRRTQDGHAITDLKTGKAVVHADGSVETKGHTFQLGVYELLAERASGLPITGPAQIIGMNTARTPAAQRVATGEIVGARDVLLGEADSPGVLESAAKIIHAGSFWGNPRSMMCHERYCPVFSTCKFRK